jgi:hypothetical protein
VTAKEADVRNAGVSRARPEVSLETGGEPPVTKRTTRSVVRERAKLSRHHENLRFSNDSEPIESRARRLP